MADLFYDEDFAEASHRVDLLQTLVEDFVKEDSKRNQAVRSSLGHVLTLIAKYQDPNDDFTDDMTPGTVERDMMRLVAHSANVAAASSRSKALAKKWYAKGKKAGAEAFLTERSRCQAEGDKFIAAVAEPLVNKERGRYGMASAAAEEEGEALGQIADHADKLCQVLKKVHDRMMREYINTGVS